METVKYEMEVPKEAKEVIDLADAVIEKIMAKSDVSDYLTLIGELSSAIDGIEGVVDEMKGQYRDEAAGYLVHKLLGRLLPVKSE